MMFLIHFCNTLQSSSLNTEFKITGCRNFFNILHKIFGSFWWADSDLQRTAIYKNIQDLQKLLEECWQKQCWTYIKLKQRKPLQKVYFRSNYLSPFAFWPLTWSRQSEITKSLKYKELRCPYLPTSCGTQTTSSELSQALSWGVWCCLLGSSAIFAHLKLLQDECAATSSSIAALVPTELCCSSWV